MYRRACEGHQAALQGGASVATLILTTESLVTDILEKETMPPLLELDTGVERAGYDYLRFSLLTEVSASARLSLPFPTQSSAFPSLPL